MSCKLIMLDVISSIFDLDMCNIYYIYIYHVYVCVYVCMCTHIILLYIGYIFQNNAPLVLWT